MTLFSLQTASDFSEIVEEIKKAETFSEKVAVVKDHSCVLDYMRKDYSFAASAKTLSDEKKYLLFSLLIIEQQQLLANSNENFLDELIEKLQVVDSFYQEIGGIIGYHYTLMKQLQAEGHKKDNLFFHPPHTVKTENHLLQGIQSMPYMAEFYPLGGAADRLHLQDEKTGKELPAAKLSLGGKTLLEYLVWDLQAREYLHYKLCQKQVNVPIVIMTSPAKENHRYITEILEKNHWFHRSKENFYIFTQPLAPAITEEGKWVANEEGLPLMKPSGHGVLWKLAKDHQVFEALHKKGIKKAIVRQINNPIGGVNDTLLSLSGYGFAYDQSFGFVCTSRQKGTAEGAVVVTEKRNETNSSYCLTNIEYCDFVKHQVDPSCFPSNTNILFLDIKAVEKAVEKAPFPGILVNMKEVSLVDKGKTVQKKIARLESTMQNIADQFKEVKDIPASSTMKKTFALFHKRESVISTAKKVFHIGGSYYETPEKCFYDLLSEAFTLLKEKCGFVLPKWSSFEQYLLQGPSVYFSYHPALGPLYSIIAQKVRQGKIEKGSFLSLELAECDIHHLYLQGSCIIQATNPMGHVEKNRLIYSHKSGKCTFYNVTIKNQGIEKNKEQKMWKAIPVHKESVHIVLKGSAELHAKDLILEGSHTFEVEDGHALYLSQKDGKLVQCLEKISKPTWEWEYSDTNFPVIEKKGSA